jgi:hypothetical protein
VSVNSQIPFVGSGFIDAPFDGVAETV